VEDTGRCRAASDALEKTFADLRAKQKELAKLGEAYIAGVHQIKKKYAEEYMPAAAGSDDPATGVNMSWRVRDMEIKLLILKGASAQCEITANVIANLESGFRHDYQARLADLEERLSTRQELQVLKNGLPHSMAVPRPLKFRR
jgi:hypothetical protein